MDQECDGTGEEVYYEYHGKRLLLCGTVGFAHEHCVCGEPIWGGRTRCNYCDLESLGYHISEQLPLREDREHLNATTGNFVKRLYEPDQNPTERNPLADHPGYKDMA